MSKKKKLERRKRQEELLKNFDGDFYQEKKIGNEWFVKHYNGNTDRWQVAVYSQDSFQRYKIFSENKERLTYLMEKE